MDNVMNLTHLFYMAVGGIVCIFFILFSIASLREKAGRAAAISALAFALFGVLWFGIYFAFNLAESPLLVAALIVALAALLYYAPLRRKRTIHVDSITERVDERDVMFAREEYQPGTEKYEKYYSMRPEYKETDDRLRELPELLAPGGKFHDPVQSSYISSIFSVIKDMTTIVDGDVNPNPVNADPAELTVLVKDMACRLGADEVGIAALNPMFVYSHVGRGPEPWGAPIKNDHKFAIAYVMEMDFDQVAAAPALAITEESAMQYLRIAQLSVSLARYIRELGYPARAHISDSNYQIMLPPVAHDAGLGELGRLGYLISPRFGPRVRLGAVTTDLPLIPDGPIEFGVQDFCEKCLKCAINCPSGAIPAGDKSNVRGVEKWPLNIEQCIRYWRIAGTDCGLCMKVCPYSHPDNLVHNILRAGIKRSAFARTVSLWGDDICYGKKLPEVDYEISA